MAQTRMIAIRYEGDEIPRHIQLLLASTVRNCNACLSNKVEIFQYDAADLTEISELSKKNPIKHALTYIGNLFAIFLIGPEKNDIRFAVSLWNGVQSDTELATAVNIIATQYTSEFASYAMRYGIGNAEIDCIRSINNYNPADVTRIAIR